MNQIFKLAMKEAKRIKTLKRTKAKRQQEALVIELLLAGLRRG